MSSDPSQPTIPPTPQRRPRPPHPWSLPYAALTADQLMRTNSDVCRQDILYLQSICVDRGIITFLVQSIVKHVTTYARANNLQFGDSDKLVEFIRESTRLCNHAVADLTPAAGSRDERGDVETAHQHSPSGAGESANLQQTPEAGRSQGGVGQEKNRVRKKPSITAG